MSASIPRCSSAPSATLCQRPLTGFWPITPQPLTTIEKRAITTSLDRKRLAKRPGIVPRDTVAAAARKTLRFHFRRMLEHEAGCIDGRDIEELHDMRVAVRRMRAAVQLFRPYLPKKHAAYLRKDLRHLGRALGPARDYDVMLANLERYRGELPARTNDSLEPLARRWQKKRGKARSAMREYLASNRYRVLKQRIGTYLESERPPIGDGDANGAATAALNALREPLVFEEVPGLLASRYEKVIAYGPSLQGSSLERLHALRIDCKRLRYALEFLREALNAQAEHAIDDLKEAQDHLGEMNDAYVASNVLRKLLEKWQRTADNSACPPATIEALGAYLAYCEGRARAKAQSFPVIWENLTGDVFRQRLHDIMTTPP